ncbi:hypothetical protein GQX74_001664, partial [Glossina fuscipes]
MMPDKNRYWSGTGRYNPKVSTHLVQSLAHSLARSLTHTRIHEWKGINNTNTHYNTALKEEKLHVCTLYALLLPLTLSYQWSHNKYNIVSSRVALIDGGFSFKQFIIRTESQFSRVFCRAKYSNNINRIKHTCTHTHTHTHTHTQGHTTLAKKEKKNSHIYECTPEYLCVYAHRI